MDCLNIIEIRGTVSAVKTNVFSGMKMARLSVLTTLAYRAKDKTTVLESTWIPVVAWEGKNISIPDTLAKGDKVYIQGRLRAVRYTRASGEESVTYEVLATRLTLIDKEKSLNPQKI